MNFVIIMQNIEINSTPIKWHQKLWNALFPTVELPKEISQILRLIEESLTGQKHISALMPSKDEIAIDINHGETLIVLNKCNIAFKRKNIIIEKALTTEQWYNVMDAISQKVEQKCNYIEESIKLGLNEVIK